MGAGCNACGRKLAWMALALLVLPAWGRAQDPGAVEQLRDVLRNTSDPPYRDQATRKCLDELRTLADLQRAAGLMEWRDRDPEPAIAAVDRGNRGLVEERFTRWVQAILRGSNAPALAATADLLAEMAASSRARGEGAGVAGRFAAELAGLAAAGPATVRPAAARALGQVEADPSVTVPVLATLLRAPDPALRKAAAGALEGMLRAGAHNNLSAPSRAAAVGVAVRVLPAAAVGLGDWHPEVRQHCLGAIAEAAVLLVRLVEDPPADRGGPPDPRAVEQAVKERAELRPLALALTEQAAALARALRDANPAVRLLAQKGLEEAARARWRWRRQLPADPDDPLEGGLRAAVSALADAVGDPELRVRRAALDVLELFGPLAEPAVPALARALEDRDRFVRWSAVRTLGRLGAAARPALPGLTRLLDDQDLDLRLAVAQALGRVEPAAHANPSGIVPASTLPPASGSRTAMPALVRSLRAGDAELRVAALLALRRMAGEARLALPALREALADPDRRVRQTAAETVGALGPAGRDAVGELREALKDPDEEVRRAARIALLNVVGTSQ